MRLFVQRKVAVESYQQTQKSEKTLNSSLRTRHPLGVTNALIGYYLTFLAEQITQVIRCNPSMNLSALSAECLSAIESNWPIHKSLPAARKDRLTRSNLMQM